MVRFLIAILVAFVFLLPVQGCIALSRNTVKVVKPKNRNHQYYDHQSKDRKKKRTKTVIMKS